MAALGIHSGGKLLYPSLVSTNKFNQKFSSNPFLFISNKAKKTAKQLVYASATPSNSSVVSLPREVATGDSDSKDAIFLEKIDSWMHDSVSDIVKNLKEAPLLVHIYSEKDGGSENGRVKIKTEKAHVDKWPIVKNEWRSGKSKSPDGLIFVEELGQDLVENQDLEEGVSRAWGIVVQGKGVECGPTCYLLKTNRVCAGMGLGFCTHFCLKRVNNFRETALKQFQDSWLLN